MSTDTRSWITELVDRCAELGCRCSLDEPLSEHTSFGVGGPADVFTEPTSVEQLWAVKHFCDEYGVPHFVIGNGTNLIANDKGFRGVVTTLWSLKSETNALLNGDYIPAGMPLKALVGRSITNGKAGLEALTGIPGSVGGAIFVNAGAYGASVSDVLSQVVLLSEHGTERVIEARQMPATYRDSGLIPVDVILGASFHLEDDDPDAIAERSSEYGNMRSRTQPLSEKSAGCIFKNPDTDSAGSVIDKAGLKGVRIGGAVVSEKHANYIVNDGSARAADVLSLASLVRDEVFKRSGVSLSMEVHVLGEHGLFQL